MSDSSAQGILASPLSALPRGAGWLGVLGSLLAPVGLAALIVHLAGAQIVHHLKALTTWLHAGVAGVLAAAGCALMVVAYRRALRSQSTVQDWMPLAAFVGAAAVGAMLGASMRVREDLALQQMLRVSAGQAAALIERSIEDQLRMLDRTALRWSVAGRPSAQLWSASSQSNLRDFPTVEALVWIDAAGAPRWIETNAAHANSGGLADLAWFRDGLRRARASRRPYVSPIGSLPTTPDAHYVVYAPLFDGARPDGLLAAICSVDVVLASVAQQAPDYVFEWRQDAEATLAGALHAYDSQRFESVAVLRPAVAAAHAWRVLAYPTAALAARTHALAPFGAFGGFLLLGAFAAAALHKARTAMLAHARSSALNLQLRDANARLAIALERLRDGENRLKLALGNARQGLWECDLLTGRVAVDESWLAMLGYDAREAPSDGPSWEALIHEDDRQQVSERLLSHLARAEPTFDVDYRIRKRDGAYLWINSLGSVQGRTLDGAPAHLLGTIQDISARKQAEALLRASVAEKETLLRELHHRVKNNFAVVSSMLYLQMRRTSDVRLVETLKETRNRVRSMAMVHESLYNGANLGAVDFGGYLRALLKQLIAGADPEGGSTRLRLELTTVHLSVNKAIPCGLIVNELVTNSLKHAWPGGARGELHVALAVEDAGRCLIRVADDGVGLPHHAVEDPSTLGMRLVRLLAEQLEGELSTPDPGGAGAVFELRFKLDADESEANAAPVRSAA